MLIEKTIGGAWVVSKTIGGYLVTRTYYGYTKSEAIAGFREETTVKGGYVVVRYSKSGKRICVISGMGRNKGTWEASHSKRTAQKYARQLREECPEFDYRVEESN